MAETLMARRWFHSMILTVLAGIVIFGLPESVPRHELFYALFVIVAWMLGQRYERAIILESGVIDPERLARVERQARGFLNWGGE